MKLIIALWERERSCHGLMAHGASAAKLRPNTFMRRANNGALNIPELQGTQQWGRSREDRRMDRWIDGRRMARPAGSPADATRHVAPFFSIKSCVHPVDRRDPDRDRCGPRRITGPCRRRAFAGEGMKTGQSSTAYAGGIHAWRRNQDQPWPLFVAAMDERIGAAFSLCVCAFCSSRTDAAGYGNQEMHVCAKTEQMIHV
jgi:hypothetical protein